MAAVDRELEITYGTLVIGGTTDVDGQDRLINGFIQIDKTFETLNVSFDFVIAKDTEALFEDEILAVETAFRTPFQDLEVKQGAETLIDCKPTTNTGLNTRPTITKGESREFDTGRSRVYTVSITADLPADAVAPTVGIQDSTIHVSFSPARRRQVSISGTVTAEGANKARPKYEAIIATYTAAVLTALGGNYELGEEPEASNDYDVASGITGGSLLTFSRVFDELIFEQAPGVTENANIVRQSVKITRGQVGPGDTPGKGASRLINMTATYDAWIDKDETTDIRDVWDDIKTWVYDQIRITLAVGVIAVTDSSPQFDYDENRISVSITAFGTSGSSVLEFTETTQVADVFGVVLVPAWEGPFSKYLYQGPASRRRTTTTTKRTLGASAGNAQPQNLGRNNFAGPGGQGFQFGIGGGNVPGVGSLGPIGAQNSVFGQSFGFGQISRSGFSIGPAGAAGAGSNSSSGSPVAAGALLAMPVDFIPISLTVSDTPLQIGTDGQTINVTDQTSVLIEEGFIGITNRPTTGGGSQSGSTGQSSGARPQPAPPP